LSTVGRGAQTDHTQTTFVRAEWQRERPGTKRPLSVLDGTGAPPPLPQTGGFPDPASIIGHDSATSDTRSPRSWSTKSASTCGEGAHRSLDGPGEPLSATATRFPSLEVVDGPPRPDLRTRADRETGACARGACA
jgi:hypothetical protein